MLGEDAATIGLQAHKTHLAKKARVPYDWAITSFFNLASVFIESPLCT
jgi:hypothetical protein